VASLLDEGVGARMMSMGGAGAASVKGAMALQWNPARLATLKDHEQDVAASHGEISRDTRVEWAGYAQQVDDGWGAASVIYRDKPGAPAGDIETSDFALSLGYAKRDDAGTAGMTARYLRSRVPGAAANSFSTDFGIVRGEDGQSTAVVIRNAGPGLRYGSIKKDLPLTFALGMALEKKSWTASGDYEYRPFTGAHDFGGGLEYELFSGLFARGGWTTKDEKAPALVLSRGFSFGGGLEWGGLRLDYAFRPKAGRYHRFDVGYRF
jgi:hypothetical protein